MAQPTTVTPVQEEASTLHVKVCTGRSLSETEMPQLNASFSEASAGQFKVIAGATFSSVMLIVALPTPTSGVEPLSCARTATMQLPGPASSSWAGITRVEQFGIVIPAGIGRVERACYVSVTIISIAYA